MTDSPDTAAVTTAAVSVELRNLASTLSEEIAGHDGGFVDGLTTAIDLIERRATELHRVATSITTNTPLGKLAVMLQLNADTVQRAIDAEGPVQVAGFFIATGWGIAATYEVPLEEMEKVNQHGR